MTSARTIVTSASSPLSHSSPCAMQEHQETLNGALERAAPAETSSSGAGGFLIPVDVKPCPDDPAKGHGVFALEAVAAGTAMWRPGLVRKLSRQQVAEQLAQLPADEAHVFLRQAFVTSEDPETLCVNPTDLGRFMNHSNDPNCLAGYSGGTALRDIAAGAALGSMGTLPRTWRSMHLPACS